MTDLIAQHALYKKDIYLEYQFENEVQNSVDKTCTLEAYKHNYKSAMPATYM